MSHTMSTPEQQQKLLQESLKNPDVSQKAIGLLASAHLKIASVHIEMAKELQILATQSYADIAPPSPASESTVSVLFADIEDDDFADSPMLNTNALERAQKSKNRTPLVNRMKLKKAPSDLPKRTRQPTGFSIFQKENFAKV